MDLFVVFDKAELGPMKLVLNLFWWSEKKKK